MITKWLHVAHLGGNPWVLPIWSAVNHAIAKGTFPNVDNDVRELGLYISTRLDMLPIITGRINTGWRDLYSETLKFGDEYQFEKNKDGYAIPVEKALLSQLLIDIDAFLFETNACCELMMMFLQKMLNHLGESIEEKKITKRFRDILMKNGHDPSWFRLLDTERNFFIHMATPYVAIDISTPHPDLLIMKENIKAFDDPTKFIRLSELDSVIKGFSEAIIIVQEYLIKAYGAKKKAP